MRIVSAAWFEGLTLHRRAGLWWGVALATWLLLTRHQELPGFRRAGVPFYWTSVEAFLTLSVAVLPLVKKDGMPEVAQRIVDDLKYDYNVVYDEKDSVGKRYRRQDAIGTPFCVTVDGQTLEDGTVTVRHRDTMEQERVMIESLPSLVEEECSYRKLFRKMNL